MKEFSNQEGSIPLITLIVIAVLIIILLILGIFALKLSERTVEKNTATSGSSISSTEDVVLEDDSDFTYSFLKLENQSEKNKNIIYSPLSIKYALKLLVEGAEGNTKDEIEKILDGEDLTKYENIAEVLSLANAVFIKDTFKDNVLDSYIDKVKEEYNAEIKYDSFGDAEGINSWVSEKTFNIINDLIADSQVQDPNLKMILVNALAIDMKWKSKFDTSDTYYDKFDEDGNNLDVAFMHKNETFSEDISYKIDDDVTVLQMDLEEHEGVELEFDAIMPNKQLLNDFISSIDEKDIDSYLSNLKKASDAKDGVNITVPRIDFDYSIKLKQELINMGMQDAFDNNADFSGITGDKSLYVSDALHKADIEFAEGGVRAAAATAVLMSLKSAVMEETHPVEVKIDKPFMFVIRDKKTGEVWFTGSVYEPVLWEDVKAEYER